MNAVIKHDIPGRLRIHLNRSRLDFREADTLQYYLQGFKCIEKAVVYERTADVVIKYSGSRDEIIRRWYQRFSGTFCCGCRNCNK